MNLAKAYLSILILLTGLIGWSQKKTSPKMVHINDSISGIRLQPKQAYSIAEPYLEEHGTDHWNPDKPLQNYIILKGKYYYVSRTNYPAKTINYYLQPAVRVDSRSGQIKFIEE